ncbi:hypothetical protein FGADI_8918 [Fusarium gaditjirri]|uniref:Heterokaryon incompatibility domain-containing protein n=1 Tax=Fusarium gaditjirri TaxID=282569 RepID=A0A8H4T139_9HYPO|nr:hypothetical protein FGADI_8918 [Fusarium gaditjirri]
MDKSHSNEYHIAIVAPLPENYETARALLDVPQQECHFPNSGAAYSLGKVGPHHVVLVGKAEDMTNVSVFVKDTVDDLLNAFPSIRAGFLIGVDATAPEDSPAKPGDIVLGFPLAPQPGLIQFDADETTISNHISAGFEMSHPPSSVKSVINDFYFLDGRRHWAEYLQHQSSRAELASAKGYQPLKQNPTKPNKVLRGKVASSTGLFSDGDLTNKVGRDNKIMCFERAGASIKSRLPFLTVCGIVATVTKSLKLLDKSAIYQTRVATVIYVMFVLHRINAAKLGKEHSFPNLFQYDPFDLESPGFRLVRLEKGVQSQLRCHLVQAYLDEELIFSYEALSYSWGSQTILHEIIVDGKPLSITEGLHEALCHLRDPYEDRMLWVDALCIDQNNIKERGHQVNRMGEIYKKADRVIIWLGYASGNAVKLMSGIDMFEKNLPLNVFSQWSREDIRWKQKWREVEARFGVSFQKELEDGLQTFMENPWFSRVWILQEVANAKRAIVECNLGNIPAKLFALLPHAMDVQVSEQCQAVLDIMPSPLKASSWWDQNRNLCNLMWKFRGCQATDPRDRVYALLGMASDLKDTGIRADYSKDELAVMQDFCDYLLGDVFPAQQSLATNIRDLQAQLPAISMELLQQKLQLNPKNNPLREFLRRQGAIAIDGQHILDLVPYGSRAMSLFLHKKTNPDVFEVLWKYPDLIGEPLPMFVAQAMEYDAEVMCQLLGPSSDPEQLAYDALREAISIGMCSWEPFLKYYHPTPKIASKLLREAMVYNPEVLPHLVSAARSPVQLLENIYLDAMTDHPRGIRIIDEHSQPAMMTNGLILKGAEAGKEVLDLFLGAIEHPIELEEDLFVYAISNSFEKLEHLTEHCIKPFNVQTSESQIGFAR